MGSSRRQPNRQGIHAYWRSIIFPSREVSSCWPGGSQHLHYGPPNRWHRQRRELANHHSCSSGNICLASVAPSCVVINDDFSIVVVRKKQRHLRVDGVVRAHGCGTRLLRGDCLYHRRDPHTIGRVGARSRNPWTRLGKIRQRGGYLRACVGRFH